jgi:FxsC-like protein
VPLFFLSYARGDDDEDVRRFYSDLCTALRRRVADPVEPIGFLDREIDLGARWSNELAEALAASQVFLAIYSPRYFRRDKCGREWGVFADRMAGYERQAGVRTNLIIPVLWVVSGGMPEEAMSLQVYGDDLNTVYASSGLYRILHLHRYQDDYLDFVERLADKIHGIAQTHRLPPSPPVPLEAAPNAFMSWSVDGAATSAAAGDGQHPGPPRRPEPTPVPDWFVTTGGSKHVHFVLAATTAHQIPAERTQRQYYGEWPADWRPFLPGDDLELAVRAQAGAVDRKFTSDVLTVDARLDELLWAARELNQIVIILVDPWALRVAGFREPLARYDGSNEPTSGVLVVLHRFDEETQRHRESLNNDVYETFQRNAVRNDPVVRLNNIDDRLSFEAALKAVLAEAQSRIFSLGRARKLPPGRASVRRRPIL